MPRQRQKQRFLWEFKLFQIKYFQKPCTIKRYRVFSNPFLSPLNKGGFFGGLRVFFAKGEKYPRPYPIFPTHEGGRSSPKKVLRKAQHFFRAF